jgi:hypothetical protein
VLVLVVGGLLWLTGCVADPPPRIGLAVSGNGQATVTWQAPLGIPFPIVAYVVTPLVNSVPQTPTRFNSTATTETVTGLTNGTSYTFEVKAINTLGNDSASSESSNPVTPEIAPLPSSFVAHYTGPTDDGTYGTNGQFSFSGTVDPNGGCSLVNGCHFDVTRVTGTWHSADICGPGNGGDLTADTTTTAGTALIETNSTNGTGFDGQLNFTVWSLGYACPGNPSEQFFASIPGPPYLPWQQGATHTDWPSIGSGTFSIDWSY